MSKLSVVLALATLALAACGSVPQRPAASQSAPVTVEDQSTSAPARPGSGGYLAGDGPGTDIPADIDATPDAIPRRESLHAYANRPYVALGRKYTPLTEPGNFSERGIASWYGKKFHGQRTSSGEVYDMYGMTAAHPTLPIPSYARVTNLANHRSVVVRINDRGPFLHDRVIDLSYAAAHKLGFIGNGSCEVEVESINPDSAATAPLAAAEPVRSEPLPSAPLAAAEPVQTEPLPPEPVAASTPPVITAGTTAAAPFTELAPGAALSAPGNTYLQLGAFKSREGAETYLARMRARLSHVGKELSLFLKDGLVRVHLGPYASADEARAMAEQLQGKLGFKPLVSWH